MVGRLHGFDTELNEQSPLVYSGSSELLRRDTADPQLSG